MRVRRISFCNVTLSGRTGAVRPHRPSVRTGDVYPVMPGMFESSAVLSPLRTRPDTAPIPLFSPQMSTISVSDWPISYTQSEHRSSAAEATWPAIPDVYARWPAIGPASDTLSKFPSRLLFRVEVADGRAKCVVCSEKLPKGTPQVLMRHNSGFRLTGYRCVPCVQPHTLRQAGGADAVEFDQVCGAPPASAPPACASPAWNARVSFLLSHHASAGALTAPEDAGPSALHDHGARELLSALTVRSKYAAIASLVRVCLSDLGSALPREPPERFDLTRLCLCSVHWCIEVRWALGGPTAGWLGSPCGPCCCCWPRGPGPACCLCCLL